MYRALENWPAILVGIFLGPPMVAVLVISGWTIANAWTARWFAPDTIFFDGDDLKIFILIGVIMVCYIGYRIFGPMKSDKSANFSWGQVGLIMTVTSLVGLVVLIGESSYLAHAKSFGETEGYLVCDLDRLKYFQELKMSRTVTGCDAQSPLYNFVDATAEFFFP